VSAYLVDDLLEVNATPLPFSNAVEDGRDIPPKAAAAIKKMLMSRQVSLVVISSSTFDSPAQKLLERNWPNIPTVTVDEVLLQDADTFQWRGGYFDYVDQAISDLAFFNGSDNK
jgi:zinc/manganese transport system substrate-binding protein